MNRNTILIMSCLATNLPVSAQQVMVLNRGDDTVTLVELSTGEMVWRVGAGAQPHEVARSVDGRVAFVGSYGGNVIFSGQSLRLGYAAR